MLDTDKNNTDKNNTDKNNTDKNNINNTNIDLINNIDVVKNSDKSPGNVYKMFIEPNLFDEDLIYNTRLEYYVYNKYKFDITIINDIIDMMFLVIFNENFQLWPIFITLLSRLSTKYYNYTKNITHNKWVQLLDDFSLSISILFTIISLLSEFPVYYLYMFLLNIIYTKLFIYFISHYFEF